MILITGASGMVGGPAVRHLLEAGHRLRALTSNPTSGDKLKTRGVTEIVVGDLRRDADVARAMEGVRCVVHIPPNIVEDEHEIGFRVVAAAEQAGVDHVVFVSCFHPHPSDIPSHHNKLLVEDALYKSALNYTVLQPSMFMQNLELMWSNVAESGALAWPWDPDQRFATIDTDDLGRAIATVVTQPRFFGGTYELSTAQEMTVHEMAATIGAAWGRPVAARRMEPALWKGHLEKQALPQWTVDNVVAMASFYDRCGYRGGNDVVFEAITGRRATTYDQFVERFLADCTDASQM